MEKDIEKQIRICEENIEGDWNFSGNEDPTVAGGKRASFPSYTLHEAPESDEVIESEPVSRTKNLRRVRLVAAFTLAGGIAATGIYTVSRNEVKDASNNAVTAEPPAEPEPAHPPKPKKESATQNEHKNEFKCEIEKNEELTKYVNSICSIPENVLCRDIRSAIETTEIDCKKGKDIQERLLKELLHKLGESDNPGTQDYAKTHLGNLEPGHYMPPETKRIFNGMQGKIKD
jgi:hypothetical protein